MPIPRSTCCFGLAALGLVACCTTRPNPGAAEAKAPAARIAAETAEQANTRVEVVDDPVPESVHEVAPYFDTPELRAAVEDFEAGRNHEAARAMERHAEAHPGTPSGRAAKLLGLLARHDGGVFEPTARELRAVADAWPIMSDYALLYAGSAYLHSDRPEEAVVVLERIPRESTLTWRAEELRARALEAAGHADMALEVLERALKRGPNARDDLWFHLARIRGEHDDPDGHFEALRELASRFPTRRLGADALRALGPEPDFSPVQWLRIGRWWYGAHRHGRALEALKHAWAGLPEDSAGRCDAAVKIARTYEKKKDGDEAWPWYEKALECDGDALADATFAGGRNRLRHDDFERAEALLARHIDTFPERTTVDDAQLMLAQAARERGDDERADELLMEDLARWPDGDMVDLASWELLWPRVQARRWEQAVAIADRILEQVPRETHYRAEGRTLYWKGRALKALDRDADARAAWRGVLEAYPLSWYAVLAYRRLEAMDPSAAGADLAAAIDASDPPPDPLARIPERLREDPHFRKGLVLARMGLHTSARRELGATASPDGVDERRGWVWTKIALYHMTGAYDRATWLARRQEPDFGAYWPKGHHRRLWELAHPRPFADLVERWAGEHDIDPFWVWSIMREESGFNPGIESWANAIGLMQIILPTAEYLARGTGIAPTRANLQRPEVAIRLGTKYLAKLISRHPVVSLASSGYNAGSGAISRWRREFGDRDLDEFVERITYREARGYAKRVTRSLARYRWLYDGGEMLELPLDPPGAP
ncbi:MAG: transglycosylase SLT domain-containing protein [Myxococcota bacterium]